MGVLKKIGKIALIYSILYFATRSCTQVLTGQQLSELEKKVEATQTIEYKPNYETTR